MLICDSEELADLDKMSKEIPPLKGRGRALRQQVCSFDGQTALLAGEQT